VKHLFIDKVWDFTQVARIPDSVSAAPGDPRPGAVALI
jgi:hypothetical protein